jgi:rare lipoprotein A
MALIAGCSSAPHRRAVAPVTSVPASPTRPPEGQVPDAIPRYEPLSRYGNPPFYVVGGRRYAVLPTSNGYIERGVASWYGTEFHGLKTSTGEPYDMFAMTAAHKTLPLPCYARVTNLSNGNSVVVRINDRGPFVDNRIIDLSYSAARRLDMIRNGTAFVQVEVLTPAAPTINADLPVNAPAAAAASIGVTTVPAMTSDSSADAPAVALPANTPAPSSASPPSNTPPMAPATSATADTAPPAAAVAPTSTFFIQVGAYAKLANADHAARTLLAGGIDHVLTLPPSGTQPLARVRIGPIQSVQQFDALLAKVTALGFPNARLAQD